MSPLATAAKTTNSLPIVSLSARYAAAAAKRTPQVGAQAGAAARFYAVGFFNYCFPEVDMKGLALGVPALMDAASILATPVTLVVRRVEAHHDKKREERLDAEAIERSEARYLRTQGFLKQQEQDRAQRRANGEHLTDLDTHAAQGVENNVALLYGIAQEAADQARVLDYVALEEILQEAENKFGVHLENVFGVDPRSVLQDGVLDRQQSVAFIAFTEAVRSLEVIDQIGPSGVTSTIRGTVDGATALGVFARATGATNADGSITTDYPFVTQFLGDVANESAKYMPSEQVARTAHERLTDFAADVRDAQAQGYEYAEIASGHGEMLGNLDITQGLV